MRILFVLNSHFWERIGILILSSILKKHQHTVSIYNINQRIVEQYIEEIKQLKPEVIAYSSMTTEIATFLQTNRELKSNLPFEWKSVFGGPHPTFFPEMIHEAGVDAVFRGEAEVAILQYMEYLQGQRSSRQVSNSWIKENGNYIKNSIALWPTDLDAIPFPDRQLWDDVDTHPVQKVFISSRGCPYKCTYCFNHAYNQLYGNPTPVVRRRSVDNFISEIKQVVAIYPGNEIMFIDDSFIMAPTSWLEEFQEKYSREVNKAFTCNIRANQVSEEKIRLLAKAGCHHCVFGLECGDEAFANQILNRNLRDDQILKAARLLKKYDIRFLTQNLNGLPSDDPIFTDMKTLELNIKCKPDYAIAHMFLPLPGTKLTQYAREKGLYTESFSEQHNHERLLLLSPLNFDIKLKKQLERQNMLFAIVVGFPFLKPVLPLLRNLPVLKLYIVLNLLYNGYCIRIKLSTARKSPKYFWSIFTIFLKKLIATRTNRYGSMN